MKISYWMTLVANRYLKKPFIKNSEHCSLFLIGLRRCVLLLLAGLALSACQPSVPQEKKITYSGPIMGTDYRVTIVHKQHQADHDIETQIVAEMALVNQSMSTYLDDSELSLLNKSPSNLEIELSEPLFDVIAESLNVSQLTDGAFDVTVGKAVNLWGFGPDGAIAKQPSEEQLFLLSQSVGYQHLSLNDKQLTKHRDGISIDLSAIAKGYAVDRVATKLEQLGVDNYLIDIGGELRAQGYSLGGQLWRIGIEKPHDLGGIQQIITLENKSIATSGDYRNYHVIDGKPFSHTIDAKTLRPVFHRLALVSVVAEKASTADALATAIMAMGELKGLTFAQKNKLAVYMVIREGVKDSYRVEMTDKFKYYLQ